MAAISTDGYEAFHVVHGSVDSADFFNFIVEDVISSNYPVNWFLAYNSLPSCQRCSLIHRTRVFHQQKVTHLIRSSDGHRYPMGKKEVTHTHQDPYPQLQVQVTHCVGTGACGSCGFINPYRCSLRSNEVILYYDIKLVLLRTSSSSFKSGKRAVAQVSGRFARAKK